MVSRRIPGPKKQPRNGALKLAGKRVAEKVEKGKRHLSSVKETLRSHRWQEKVEFAKSGAKSVQIMMQDEGWEGGVQVSGTLRTGRFVAGKDFFSGFGQVLYL